MRKTTFSRTLLLVGLAAALVWSSGPPAVAGPATSGGTPARYRAVDLGTLGGESSYSIAMNDRGAVVGRAQVADGTYHGFLWRRGRMTDLGLFTPSDVNNSGQVVGTRDDIGGAWVWRAGTVRPLANAQGRLSFPRAINDRGQVVGSAPAPDGPDVPALWTRGRLRHLPLDDVSDLNRRGTVSGGVLTDGGFHPAVWRRGRVTDLGAAAFDRGNTYRLNDRGWVLGWTFDADQDERATLWRRGRPTDLGDLGGRFTHGIALNSSGAVLAVSQVADGGTRPALWRRGVLTDLTTRGVGGDSDYVDLDDRGRIAGATRVADGVAHAMVWRPVRR